MSTLITGAAGFVGSHLTDRLLARGNDVVGLDSFDDFYPRAAKEENLLSAHQPVGFDLVTGDLRDEGLLAELPGDIDAVVHLAARVGVRASIQNPRLYASVNDVGTWTLLEWARSRGVRTFVFASSSSVYGDCDVAPLTEALNIGRPISPYAATKRAGELACQTFHHLHGMSIVALRFFTVFGPRQRPDLAIHKFARLLADGRPIPMYGDGTSARDYTYIDDIVDGIEGALRFLNASSDPVFEIVNLGKGRPVALSEMIRELAAEMGIVPEVERRQIQPGDVLRTCADVSKAYQIFGYESRWRFREGVREFLRWMGSPR